MSLEEGAKAIRERESSGEEVRQIWHERELMARALAALPGIEEVYESEANFLLFRCQEPTRIVKMLRNRGVIVRDRSSLPGLKGCVRVSIGVPGENGLFLQELQKCLEVFNHV
jgi:histidinol-phosphate aminotransferase